MSITTNSANGEMYSIQYCVIKFVSEMYSIQYCVINFVSEMYSIQYCVIKFVSDLWQLDCFIRVLQMSPPSRMAVTI